MVSRRSFLKQSSLGAVAAGMTPGLSQAQSSSPSPQGLPPAIAALTPQRDKATPITSEERRGRIERAKRLMAEQRIDAVLLTGGTSTVYFTNVRWWVSERLFAILLPVKGTPFVVCPAFEEERAHEQLSTGPVGGAQVYTWEEDEDPYARVAQGLRERGLATGRLGVEETVKFVFSDGIAKASPQITLTSGTPVTAGCRMIKDAHELQLMRLASHVTLKAYEAAWKSLKDGMTQSEFARLVQLAHQQLGFQGSAGVQVGEFSALPHGSVQPQVVREGTILLIDGGCNVEGYVSDISRTFVLGRAGDEMNKVFDVVHRAQTAALKTARPGLACEAVDAAARKVVEEAGYGPGYKHFTHRVGHGMGMDGHEWTYLVKGNKTPLSPGMVFSDEPGIYIRGKFGVRLEDDMVITENGAELFTPQSESLEKPF
jgi:Xaa-Pro dipeptidase